MKKGVVVLLFLGILLLSSLVQAQTYSGVDRLTDNVKLILSSGDDKVELALEIRENEIDSALENVDLGNEDAAIKNLEKAENKLQIVQEGISLETTEEVKTSVEEITNKINDKENLPEEFDTYIIEEEKTQLKAELTEKTFEYCKELAKEDYNLMLKQEKCNPETAPKSIKKELNELDQIQKEAFIELMLDIRSCIDDPGTCQCEDNVDITQKAKCEKMVALAVKCEYKDDTGACNELKSMKPVKGDSFAESFVPAFLMNLFREKEYMIDYNIKKSDVPEECYNENERVKTQCAQYRSKKELSSKCWDEDGNFLVEECGGPEENVPTMQDSIPQCFDENNIFLTDKCGKVTIVWNEKGLINYLFEGELNKIIENFENASEQHMIDINGKEGQTVVNEIKEDIKGLEVQIALRTFAPGTEGTGESGPDIKNVVVEGGEGGSGDDGLKPEIKTDMAGGSGSNNEPLPESDLSGTHYDPANDEVVTNNIDEGPGGSDSTYAEGTSAEGTNTGSDVWTATAVADGGTTSEGGNTEPDTWTATAVAI